MQGVVRTLTIVQHVPYAVDRILISLHEVAVQLTETRECDRYKAQGANFDQSMGIAINTIVLQRHLPASC